MTDVSTSIEITAAADKVWAVIGGFDNLPLWLSLIERSTLEDGGRVRRLEAVGGAVIVECLLHFDEAARSFRYSHLEAPDPVTGYEAEMHVEGIYCVGLHALKALMEA